jgi:hypothetical protein
MSNKYSTCEIERAILSHPVAPEVISEAGLVWLSSICKRGKHPFLCHFLPIHLQYCPIWTDMTEDIKYEAGEICQALWLGFPFPCEKISLPVEHPRSNTFALSGSNPCFLRASKALEKISVADLPKNSMHSLSFPEAVGGFHSANLSPASPKSKGTNGLKTGFGINQIYFVQYTVRILSHC